MSENQIPSLKRCAIYTRKSTNHLLDRETNSLETQREICAAFIKSQMHKGWVELPQRYDDGGQSGNDIDRPALSTMMKDIEAGLVDVVVIYKIDRLTRSLAAFVQLIEVFDRYGIPFVSISQAFDTSDSMGRMIVNILLTFSQFERELIADRVRDNIRMRQRHGKWAGGMPPFGYDLTDDGLRVVKEEAETVRFIFQHFLQSGTYMGAKRAVHAAGLRSTVKFTKTGVRRVDRPLSSGSVYKILNNPVYVGEIASHDGTYPGVHEAIISRETWEAANALRAARVKPDPHWKQTNHFLQGLLWDSFGRRMRLSIEWDRGRAYYYYVSSNAYWSQREQRKQFRSHAARLDQLAMASVANFLCDRPKLRSALKSLGVYGAELDKLTVKGKSAAKLLSSTPPEALRELFAALVLSMELGLEHLSITFRSVELRRFLLWSGLSTFRGRPAEWAWSDAKYVLEIAVRAVSSERSPVLPIKARDPTAPFVVDARQVQLIQTARRAQKLVEEQRERSLDDLAGEFGCRPSHFCRLVRLNYLAPDIVTSILDGTQPTSLTRKILFDADLPLDWSLQRRLFGFPIPEKEVGLRRPDPSGTGLIAAETHADLEGEHGPR